MLDISPEEERYILLRRLYNTIIWGVLMDKLRELGATKVQVDQVEKNFWRVGIVDEHFNHLGMEADIDAAIERAVACFHRNVVRREQ